MLKSSHKKVHGRRRFFAVRATTTLAVGAILAATTWLLLNQGYANLFGVVAADWIGRPGTDILPVIATRFRDPADYLGRSDFYTIGNSLFEEMKVYHLISDEFAWNRLQVSFLNVHRFHTYTNKSLREPVKRRYLEELKDVVAAY